MPGRSTTDAILIKLEKHREDQKDIIVIFIDLNKAYDRVPRDDIWRCMRERSVPEKYVSLIEDMRRGCQTKMSSASGESGCFNMDVRMRQGSVPHTRGCTNRGDEERSARINYVCGRQCNLWR